LYLGAAHLSLKTVGRFSTNARAAMPDGTGAVMIDGKM
jgi:hypothetical protein